MKTPFPPMPVRWLRPMSTAALALLLGCAAPARLPAGWPESLRPLLPADVILLGEQHDAPAHQAMQAAAVQWLVAQGRLSALVLEMAEAGHSTQALPPSADESTVRAALGWDEQWWPWEHYAGAVMAAVRAGVPVFGGNLPRASMASAMSNTALDQLLPAAALADQRSAVREGHCDLLPEAQLPGMVRIQMARDQSMARTLAAAPRGRGQTVLLIAGGGHVLRSRGVPVYLPKNLEVKVALAQAGQAKTAIESEADLTPVTAELPPQDACAPLRKLSGR
ncbi:MAG: ChaN family lipoprotein [Giesbergeria sp.]|nr:ChaN family lipoprotein [Giesbergeria sp.]MBP6159345.1 ChaN family lipoprotein [Giesbergeria sp.]MBP7083241.1 ChaN family lipoprotein [Giesbergeria sp.]MBP9783325.1 ChaN family lipoprotein [Giesbergeria sp.]